MSCNFNGGHGSVLDFQHYTHPWSKLRTKGGISYKSCLSIILGHKSSKWFGTDGKLVALPNPLRKKPTRPINLDDDTVSSNDPLTFFCPPTLPGKGVEGLGILKFIISMYKTFYRNGWFSSVCLLKWVSRTVAQANNHTPKI